MPPAARITDMHTCPMVTGVVPHVGGPIAKGEPTVVIGFMPAARVGDIVTCVGPPDTIIKGSPTVFIGYMPAARVGDSTVHGGIITLGHLTTMIGDAGSGGGGAGGGAGSGGKTSTGAATAGGGGAYNDALAQAGQDAKNLIEAADAGVALVESDSTDELTTEPETDLADIEFRVIDEEARPKSGVRMRIVGPDGATYERVTDGNGCIVLTDVLDGDYGIVESSSPKVLEVIEVQSSPRPPD